MFPVPEGPSEAKIPITVRRIHLIRRPYAKRRGRRETMFDCPLSKTVKILDQRSCSKQLARVSVRAAMLVRLRALDVVLGRSPRPESSTDRKEAKRAKATRLAAVHVVSESGIPADRGSFGA